MHTQSSAPKKNLWTEEKRMLFLSISMFMLWCVVVIVGVFVGFDIRTLWMSAELGSAWVCLYVSMLWLYARVCMYVYNGTYVRVRDIVCINFDCLLMKRTHNILFYFVRLLCLSGSASFALCFNHQHCERIHMHDQRTAHTPVSINIHSSIHAYIHA